MHTAQWDPTVDLTGKRVAVIGTGASGVQVVPELADTAARLTVFQRTPPWMVPKEDRPYSAEELTDSVGSPWASLRERWRLWKLQHDNTALTPDHPRLAVVQELSENFLRKHVADDELRDALTPRYPFRCKRVLLGEKYYTALQRAHVDLVTDPIDRVTDTSVVTAGGRVVDVDVIVLATGFETSSYLSGLDVIGVDGESLHDRWGLDPQAYLGVAVSGFPNFFMLYGPNTNQGANSIIYILEAGARLVASAVSRLARRGGFVDVRPDVEHRFNDQISAESGADHLDAMRQLLPIALRSHRHPVAALGTRLRTGDVAITATRLDSRRPGAAASGRHRQRQRWHLVLRRYAVRRLQAVGPGPRDGPGRIRGVPGDEGHRPVWDNRRW